VKLILRKRKILLAGIIIVAAVLIFYEMISLLPNRVRLLQQVETDKKIILKQREILSLEESYRKRAEQADSRLKHIMTRLLPGENYNVASAELQNVLKDFADQNGVDITTKTTIQEKKVPDNEFLTKVAVRIDVNCDLEQLVNFLTSIENYDKFLKVEELEITSYKMQKKYDIRPRLMIAGYIPSPNLKSVEGSFSGAKAPSTVKNQATR
jgi:Tfp pilus assembly protein PilO